MRGWTLPLVILWTFGAPLGCSRDNGDDKPPETKEGRDYGTGVCSAIEACGCLSAHESTTACVDTFRARFDAAADGLKIDATCLAAALESPALDECAELPWTEAETGSCEVITGSRGEGQKCSEHDELPGIRVSECKADLVCFRGACTHPDDIDPLPQKKQEGEGCYAEAFSSCGNADLYCSSAGVCDASAENGYACTDARGCVAGYCAGLGSASQGECAPLLENGAACDPRDFQPCIGDTEEGWCPPADEVCTSGAPGICQVTHPLWRG